MVSQVCGNCKAFRISAARTYLGLWLNLGSCKVVDMAMKVYPDGCNIDEPGAV